MLRSILQGPFIICVVLYFSVLVWHLKDDLYIDFVFIFKQILIGMNLRAKDLVFI